MVLSHNRKLPLTEGQKEIWIAQQVIEFSPRYNTAECVRIKGEISKDCFEKAVNQVMKQIEALNCQYELQNGELLQILSDRDRINYEFLDFTEDKNPEHSLQRWIKHDIKQPVNLQKGALYCVALIQLATQEYCWYQRTHHIALDGYGVAMVLREISMTYSLMMQGKNTAVPAFTGLDYLVKKEQKYKESPQFKQDERFWQDYCQQLDSPPRLSPVCGEVSDTVNRNVAILPAGQFVRMKVLAEEAGVCWVDVWLAVFASYLSWKTQKSGIVLGLPFMNRNEGALFKLPGMMVNILPLSLPVLPDDDLLSLARKARQEIDKIKPHSQFRGMQLLRLRADDEPLFGPVVNVLPFYDELDLHGVAGVVENVYGGPVDDCALRVVPASHADDSDLHIHIDANPAGYQPEELQAISAELTDWCAFCLTHPKASMISLAQHSWFKLADYVIQSSEPGNFVWQDVISRIRRQATLSPQAIALESDNASLSYSQLVSRFDSIALALTGYGVQPEKVVAVCLPDRTETIMIMLGILAAGASCFVLDTSFPDDRLAQAMTECKACYVVVTGSEDERCALGVEPLFAPVLLGSGPQPGVKQRAIQPEMTSFIIFTSGSTGKPKGVAIPHQALSWFVEAAGKAYNIQAEDKVLQFSALTFDACLEEIFIPLCRGACVVPRTEEMGGSLDAFLTFITKHAITILDLPTTFWHTLTLSLSEQPVAWPSAVKTLIVGGEALSQQRLSQWKALMGERVRLINTYGPTEGTIVFTWKVLAGEGFDPETSDLRSIGLPLAGLSCLILDDAQRPVRQGSAGELYLAGPTLSSGYINSAEMTQESFVRLALGEEILRAYKTGDRVRQNLQGEIVYIGRIDRQVKFRGYRVDLNEIRDCSQAVPGVKETRAVMWPEGNGRLVLYIQLEAGSGTSVRHVGAYLQQRLPQYMLPNQIVILDEFPLTPSGKIDEKRLPKSEASHDSAVCQAERSDFERLVAEAWQKELSLQSVGVHQDFYALGGSSLNLFSVHARLVSQGLSIAPRLLLENRTIHQLYQAWLQAGTDVQHALPELELVVKLQNNQRSRKLWAFHPWTGHVDCYRLLAEKVSQYFDLWAFQAPFVTGDATEYRTLHDLAKLYTRAIRHEQKEGPYYLTGYSLGGNIAYLVARLLSDRGLEVSYLGMLDCRPPQHVAKMANPLHTMVRERFGSEYLGKISALDEEEQLEAVASELVQKGPLQLMTKKQLLPALRFSFNRGSDHQPELQPLSISGQVYHYGFSAPGDEWGELIPERLHCHQFEGDHDLLMNELSRSGAMKTLLEDLLRSSPSA